MIRPQLHLKAERLNAKQTIGIILKRTRLLGGRLLVRLPYMACSTSAMVACMKQMMVEVEQQQQAGIPCTGPCSQAHPDCLTRMIVQLLATTEVAATDAANNRTAGPIRAFWAPAHLSCHTATGAVPPSNNTCGTAGLLGCQESAVHCYADACGIGKRFMQQACTTVSTSTPTVQQHTSAHSPAVHAWYLCRCWEY